MIKILNQQKNVLIDATNESILIGGKDLNCIMVTKTGSANGFLTAGIYENEEEAQKVFDYLIKTFVLKKNSTPDKLMKYNQIAIIEMPQKGELNEGEQGIDWTNDKI